MNTPEQKQVLRKKFRQLRASLTPEHKLSAERKISEQLNTLLSAYPIQTVGSYQAFETEVCLTHLHDMSDVDFCFPRVNGDHLDFYRTDGVEDFEISDWGIYEPKAKESHRVGITEIDAIIVPGLVFDRHCQRMGYGRGFYDRALRAWPGFRIGVAFQIQISNDVLLTESHDLPMNYLVTEEYIFRPITH